MAPLDLTPMMLLVQEDQLAVLESWDNQDPSSGAVVDGGAVPNSNQHYILIDPKCAKYQWEHFSSILSDKEVQKSFAALSKPENRDLQSMLANVLDAEYFEVTLPVADSYAAEFAKQMSRWEIGHTENSVTVRIPRDVGRLSQKEFQTLASPLIKPDNSELLPQEILTQYGPEWWSLHKMLQASLGKSNEQQFHYTKNNWETIGGNSFTELLTFPSLLEGAAQGSLEAQRNDTIGSRIGWDIAVGGAAALNFAGGFVGMVADLAMVIPAIEAQLAYTAFRQYIYPSENGIDFDGDGVADRPDSPVFSDLLVDPAKGFSLGNIDSGQIWCADGVVGLWHFVTGLLQLVLGEALVDEVYGDWIMGEDNSFLSDELDQLRELLAVNKDHTWDAQIVEGIVGIAGAIIAHKAGAKGGAGGMMSEGLGAIGRPLSYVGGKMPRPVRWAGEQAVRPLDWAAKSRGGQLIFKTAPEKIWQGARYVPTSTPWWFRAKTPGTAETNARGRTVVNEPPLPPTPEGTAPPAANSFKMDTPPSRLRRPGTSSPEWHRQNNLPKAAIHLRDRLADIRRQGVMEREIKALNEEANTITRQLSDAIGRLGLGQNFTNILVEIKAENLRYTIRSFTDNGRLSEGAIETFRGTLEQLIQEHSNFDPALTDINFKDLPPVFHDITIELFFEEKILEIDIASREHYVFEQDSLDTLQSSAEAAAADHSQYKTGETDPFSDMPQNYYALENRLTAERVASDVIDPIVEANKAGSLEAAAALADIDAAIARLEAQDYRIPERLTRLREEIADLIPNSPDARPPENPAALGRHVARMMGINDSTPLKRADLARTLTQKAGELPKDDEPATQKAGAAARAVDIPRRDFDELYKQYTNFDPNATRTIGKTTFVQEALYNNGLVPMNGYWAVGGDFNLSGPLGRFYVSARSSFAKPYLAALKQVYLEAQALGYKMEYKVPLDPNNWGRADASVIYFEAAHEAWFLKRISQLISEHNTGADAWVRDNSPLFTARVLDQTGTPIKGLSFGMDPPPGGTSFGSKIADVLTDVAATLRSQNGTPITAAQFYQLVADKFNERGINPNKPAFMMLGDQPGEYTFPTINRYTAFMDPVVHPSP